MDPVRSVGRKQTTNNKSPTAHRCTALRYSALLYTTLHGALSCSFLPQGACRRAPKDPSPGGRRGGPPSTGNCGKVR
eukprot:10729433-Alexandrium_andersonii.AAC.1